MMGHNLLDRIPFSCQRIVDDGEDVMAPLFEGAIRVSLMAPLFEGAIRVSQNKVATNFHALHQWFLSVFSAHDNSLTK